MGKPRKQKAKAAPEPVAQRREREFFWWILGGISLLALILRLAGGFQLQSIYPAVEHPSSGTDMATYLDFAQQLLNGEFDWNKGFYYQPFYYAAFLPFVFAIFGAGATGVIVVQSLVGALTVGLVGLSFSQLFGRRAGLIAALLLCLCRMHIFYTPFMLMAVLQGFNLVLVLWLAIMAWRRQDWWWWGLVGLACGIGNATRGNLILIVPLVMLLAGWRFRQQKARIGLVIAILLVTFYLPQLPFAMVNYRALGKWVGPSSAAGAVLSLGNTPEAPPGGRDPEMGPGPMEYPATCMEWSRLASLPEPDQVTVGSSILDWFTREPLAYIELKWRMLLLFWNRAEIPNNVALSIGGQPISSFVASAPFLLDFLLLGTLGLVGMVLCLIARRRQPLSWLAVTMVLVYCASIVLFYILARFRLPVVPLLCGFGGFALAQLYTLFQRARKGNSMQLTVAAGVLFVCFVTVGWGFDIYRFSFEKGVMRSVRPNGVQVHLEHGWMAKDNGPMSFGGWIPVPAGNISITKVFAVPPDAPQDGQALLRLPINNTTERQLDLVIMVDGKDRYPVSVTTRFEWIEVPVPGSAIANGTVTFRIVPASLAQLSGIVLIIDSQRDYGRTQFHHPEYKDLSGELVSELIIQPRSATP